MWDEADRRSGCRQATEDIDVDAPRPTRAVAADTTAKMRAQARDAFFIETCLEYVSQGEEPTIAVAEAFSAVAGFYGYEPDTYYQAITCRDAKDWQEAMKKEMDALFKLNAFEYVDENQAAKWQVISSKWVYKI